MEQEEFEYNGQVFTRDCFLDRFKIIEGERIISKAYRVYNNDRDKFCLPIAYIIQLWPNKSFSPTY